MEAYNAKLLDGKRRKFPTDMLVGAEEVLARLYHEHTKSELYMPLGLGEILSHRTFTPDKGMQRRAANAARGVQTLRLDQGKLVASSEKEWTPKSMMAIMDGADAAKWALLVGIGTEEDVEKYIDWYKATPERLATGPRLLVRLRMAHCSGHTPGHVLRVADQRHYAGRHGVPGGRLVAGSPGDAIDRGARVDAPAYNDSDDNALERP